MAPGDQWQFADEPKTGLRFHEQVSVQTNARVDKDIAGVIAALSKFPLLQTVESCQGHNGRNAWIGFH